MSLCGQLRPLKCELSFLKKADGSCSFSQGKTTVWASCSGPGDIHISRRENDSMHIDVSYRQTTGDCQHHRLNNILESTLESTLLVKLFPRTCLTVTIHALQRDGSVGAAALTAAGLAVLDNGIPCKGAFCGVHVVRVGDQLILDPDAKMESASDASLLFAFQMTSDGGASVISSDCLGPFSVSEFLSAVSLATNGAKQIFSFFKETMKSKLSVDEFSRNE